MSILTSGAMDDVRKTENVSVVVHYGEMIFFRFVQLEVESGGGWTHPTKQIIG